MTNPTELPRLIAAAKAHGRAPLLLSLLEAFEPLAPVLAQALLVAQPVANLWRAGEATRELAELLDEPAGLQALRRLLADESLK